MIANAGVAGISPLHESEHRARSLEWPLLTYRNRARAASVEEFERMMNINVMGTFFSYKYAALQMIAQGTGGRIVGAASIASKQGAVYFPSCY